MNRIGKNPDYTAVIYDPATEETVKTSHEGTQVSGKSSMGKWTHQGLYLHERLSYDYRTTTTASGLRRPGGWNRSSARATRSANG